MDPKARKCFYCSPKNHPNEGKRVRGLTGNLGRCIPFTSSNRRVYAFGGREGVRLGRSREAGSVGRGIELEDKDFESGGKGGEMVTSTGCHTEQKTTSIVPRRAA